MGNKEKRRGFWDRHRERVEERGLQNKVAVALEGELVEAFKAMTPEGTRYQDLMETALTEWLALREQQVGREFEEASSIPIVATAVAVRTKSFYRDLPHSPIARVGWRAFEPSWRSFEPEEPDATAGLALISTKGFGPKLEEQFRKRSKVSWF